VAKSLVNNAGPELYKGWQTKASGRKAVGRAVRTFLMDMGLDKERRDRLYEKIMRGLEYYG
jgi:hypothetical protein